MKRHTLHCAVEYYTILTRKIPGGVKYLDYFLASNKKLSTTTYTYYIMQLNHLKNEKKNIQEEAI